MKEGRMRSICCCFLIFLAMGSITSQDFYFQDSLTLKTGFHPSKQKIQQSINLPEQTNGKIEESNSSSLKELFVTYYGGTDDDISKSIAFDNSGNSYITGYTLSLDLPIKNAYQRSKNGSYDSFIAKFSNTGEIIFSSYFGGFGNDYSYGITVDSNGNSYIVGQTDSIDFPTKNAFNYANEGDKDVFLAKFNPNGKLVFSTYFGGNDSEISTSIALDNSNNIYISGLTSSSNFPIKNAYNSSFEGKNQVFITKFSSTGNLLFSTFFAGNNSAAVNSMAISNE